MNLKAFRILQNNIKDYYKFRILPEQKLSEMRAFIKLQFENEKMCILKKAIIYLKKICPKYLGAVKASLPYSSFRFHHDTSTDYVFFLPFQNLLC